MLNVTASSSLVSIVELHGQTGLKREAMGRKGGRRSLDQMRLARTLPPMTIVTEDDTDLDLEYRMPLHKSLTDPTSNRLIGLKFRDFGVI